MDHVPSKDVLNDIQTAVQLLLGWRNPHFAVWISIYNLYEYLPPHPCVKSPSQTNGTALHYATMYGCHDVTVFLQKISNHDGSQRYDSFFDAYHYDAAGNQAPLSVASALGHIEVVRLLLSQGANANPPCENRRTPLHWRSPEGHLEVAQLPLQNHANTNAKDGSYRDSLHLTSREGHLEVVRLLLEKGADANVQNTSKQTPLHCASQEGGAEIAKLLL